MDIKTGEGGEANAVVSGQGFVWTDWLFAVALLAAVFLAYKPCWHGGFLFDDDVHLLNNPVLKSGGLAKVWIPGGYINYWPLTFTAYWLQFQLWGLRPLGYHLVNIALHALSALLVWRVLKRLQVPGAMFAAAIFALHPVNVESVAWIAQLKGILALALALTSVLLYLRYERHGSRWQYGLAIAAFLLSALAKGSVVMLPVVLLACAWWQRGRIGRGDVLRVLPYFLIGALMAGGEVWAQHFLAKGDVVRSDDFISRAAVAGCALWFYLGKLLWPVGLTPIYPRWSIDADRFVSYLPGIAWMMLLAWAWWRRRTWGRPVVMLMVCYAALLLPVLGFVNISFMEYSLVSDHWQYVAMIVPCAVFAGASATLMKRLWRGPAAAWWMAVPAVALVAVLAVLTWHQSEMYGDAETFYETMIDRDPDCWLAETNLGNVLTARGKVDAAIVHLQRALAIKPDYAVAENNLAFALARRGKIDSAIAHYEKGIEINPNYAEAHNNLALVLVARGQIDPAIAHYQKALEIKPDYAEVHYNLANALAARGQNDSAIEHYKRALEINPDIAEAHNNLANLMVGRGDLDSAIEHYRKALELAPDNAMARQNLAAVLAERERIQKTAPRKTQ